MSVVHLADMLLTHLSNLWHFRLTYHPLIWLLWQPRARVAYCGQLSLIAEPARGCQPKASTLRNIDPHYVTVIRGSIQVNVTFHAGRFDSTQSVSCRELALSRRPIGLVSLGFVDKLSAGSYGRLVAIEAGFLCSSTVPSAPSRPAWSFQPQCMSYCERVSWWRFVEMTQIAGTISHYAHNARILIHMKDGRSAQSFRITREVFLSLNYMLSLVTRRDTD